MKKSISLFPILCLTFVSSLQSQWIQTNGPQNGSVRCLAVIGTSLFAGTDGGGVFLSTNDGTNWISVNGGLTSRYVSSLVVSDSNLFAGTNGGVFFSSDMGTSWIAANIGLTNIDVRALVVSGKTLVAGTNGGGVFRSTNGGASWAEFGLTGKQVFALAVGRTGPSAFIDLYAGTYGAGVFRSRLQGVAWNLVNSGLTNTYVFALAASGGYVFAGTYGGGLFRSTDQGTTWTECSGGLTKTTARCLTINAPTGETGGINLFAGTDGGGVYFSIDSARTWIAVGAGLEYANVRALAVSGNYLYAGSYGTGVWRRPLSELMVPEPEWTFQYLSPQGKSLRGCLFSRRKYPLRCRRLRHNHQNHRRRSNLEWSSKWDNGQFKKPLVH